MSDTTLTKRIRDRNAVKRSDLLEAVKLAYRITLDAGLEIDLQPIAFKLILREVLKYEVVDDSDD